ncbi:hypothetical protein EXIGLDRAFT_737213 [Exidia glandulosa HHB12029]|uniref:Uncharacterized protein n=1 Tax=Exidia glandulosa HHB12029 TaxID=1314781 RepID=A0A166MZZ7_EXIGL|nr:hypothetical protein EXIGLDRAFT_737213 [Exidia glandulosa HHB12029]
MLYLSKFDGERVARLADKITVDGDPLVKPKDKLLKEFKKLSFGLDSSSLHHPRPWLSSSLAAVSGATFRRTHTHCITHCTHLAFYASVCIHATTLSYYTRLQTGSLSAFRDRAPSNDWPLWKRGTGCIPSALRSQGVAHLLATCSKPGGRVRDSDTVPTM